jgi:hypothetical protein
MAADKAREAEAMSLSKQSKDNNPDQTLHCLLPILDNQ